MRNHRDSVRRDQGNGIPLSARLFRMAVFVAIIEAGALILSLTLAHRI